MASLSDIAAAALVLTCIAFVLLFLTMGAKAAIASHTVVFLAGFAAGKLFDRDELNQYRESHEKPMTRLRRYAGNAAIGAVAVGALLLVSRIASVASRGSKTSAT